MLCPSCGKKTPGAWPISMEALKCLRHYQRSGFSEAARLRPSQAIHREIEALMTYYFTYLLERSLNTPPFLRRARLVQGEEGVQLSERELTAWLNSRMENGFCSQCTRPFSSSPWFSESRG